MVRYGIGPYVHYGSLDEIGTGKLAKGGRSFGARMQGRGQILVGRDYVNLSARGQDGMGRESMKTTTTHQ